MDFKDRVVNDLKTDVNLARIKSMTSHAAKSLPSSTITYLVDKLPIIRWLPKYPSDWIVHDVIAGTTIGLLLIPQSLAYAKIATIPEQFGLMSSWIPPLVYAFMGTSKDVCPGPTSIIGVLIAEVVKDFSDQDYSPQQIAGALTFLVGLISLVVGMMKLGFILSFISVPVLSGFVSAAGLLTILSQIPVFFGNKAGKGTARKLYDIFAKLPEAKLYDTLIGLCSIIFLILIEHIGKRWGKKSKVIWAISICRNAITILFFTILSYLFNKNVPKPFFAISQTSESAISLPSLPSGSLLRRLLSRSIAFFIAMSMEHLAIAKTFSRKNGYIIDGSQELVFLGISNFLNGFFPTTPGGGSFSRSAVNSESGVKTPLSGIVTSGFVIISIYFLTGALYWIPQATLSAVVILAVWSLLVGPSTFYKYWRISFTDFVASMIAFWVTLFVSIEAGIGLAVCFSILHIAFRMAFASAITIDTREWPNIYPNQTPIIPTSIELLLKDTIVFNFKQSILFLNAERCKTDLLETYKRHSFNISCNNVPPIPDTIQIPKESSWNESISSRSDISPLSTKSDTVITVSSPSTLVFILDLSHVFYIDVTGIQALTDVRHELYLKSNSRLQWRFVGLRDSLRARLECAGWKFREAGAEDWDTSIFRERDEDAPIALFQDMHFAVTFGQSK